MKRIHIEYRVQGAADVDSTDLALRFNVDAPIKVTPVFLSFSDGGGMVANIDSLSVKVSLSQGATAVGGSGRRVEPLAIESAAISNEAFTTTMERRNADWIVNVRFDRAGYRGPYPVRTNLRIMTGRDDMSVIDVPVYATQVDSP